MNKNILIIIIVAILVIFCCIGLIIYNNYFAVQEITLQNGEEKEGNLETEIVPSISLDKIVTNENLPIGQGTMTITGIDNAPSIVIYGTEKTKILSFSLNINPVEDFDLSGIAIEFYEDIYGDMMDTNSLKNLILSDENNQFIGRASSLSVSDKKTYVWFAGKTVLPRNSSTKFILYADVAVDSDLEVINSLIPNWTGGSPFKNLVSRFRVIGKDSGKGPKILGQADNMVYFISKDKGAFLTVWSDKNFKPFYSRVSKEVILTKVYFSAGQNEDVELSKVGLRLSNYIPGQFENLKLIQEDGRQFGVTIKNPLETDANNPNLIFNDKVIVKAGSALVFNLVSDVYIPSQDDSEYGTQLQREVLIYVLNEKNYKKWIGAKGVSSENISVMGAVGTFLNFNNDVYGG